LKVGWIPEKIHERLDSQELPTVSPGWIYQYIFNDKTKGEDLFTHYFDGSISLNQKDNAVW